MSQVKLSNMGKRTHIGRARGDSRHPSTQDPARCVMCDEWIGLDGGSTIEFTHRQENNTQVTLRARMCSVHGDRMYQTLKKYLAKRVFEVT